MSGTCRHPCRGGEGMTGALLFLLIIIGMIGIMIGERD